MEEEDGSAVFRLEFEDESSGHDFVFVDELSEGQKCSICLVAMRNPVQTKCGHRFCESCLLGTFREGPDQVCPHDRNPIPEDGGFFRDVAWERDILSLRVICKKNERGCDWTGQLRHYEEHLCEYEDVACADCFEVMQKRLLQTHTTSECQLRIVQCEYCKMELEFWRTENHKGGECTRFPLDCPQECGMQEIPREEVDSHVKDDCMMTMVVCPYEGAGCTFHDKRSNLKAHLEDSSEEHLNKTWSMLLTSTDRLNELEGVEEQIKQLQIEKMAMKLRLNTLEVVEYQVRALETEKGSMKEEIADLKSSVNKLVDENVELKKDMAERGRQLEEVKHTTQNDVQRLERLIQLMFVKFHGIQVTQPHNPTGQMTQPLNRNDQSTQPLNRTAQWTQPPKRTAQSAQPLKRTGQVTQPLNRTAQSTQLLNRTAQSVKPLNPASQPSAPRKTENAEKGKKRDPVKGTSAAFNKKPVKKRKMMEPECNRVGQSTSLVDDVIVSKPRKTIPRSNQEQRQKKKTAVSDEADISDED